MESGEFCEDVCAYVKHARLAEYVNLFDIFNISNIIVKPHGLSESHLPCHVRVQ